MTEAVKKRGATRDAALEFMRSKPSGGQESQNPNRAGGRLSIPFAELPQYRQILVHAAAGKQMGVENPFYRAHEGAAGATTVIDNKELLNFASYDYLGLNQHPLLRQSANEAIDRYGISASASRLVAGERPIHRDLEAAIARFYGVDASVAFVSGYLTNVTTISCLVGQPDLVLHDHFIHNSALAGAQFSGATRRVFKHNDMEDLERQLASQAKRHRRVLVIVEGHYSMDGDIADLNALIQLKKEYGFWLMVDEAHALGVLGETGRGTWEHFGCDPRDVDIWMGTLSKTTASCGGYVAGSEELIAILKGFAGGYVYSVGLAPALAAAALTALEIVEREPERTVRLKKNGRFFLERAKIAGLDVGTSAGFSVTPVVVGDSARAVFLSSELLEDGVNVLPILFPAVPEGMARLRFFITSEHTEEQLQRAIDLTAAHLTSLIDRGVGLASIDPDLVAKQVAVESELAASR